MRGKDFQLRTGHAQNWLHTVCVKSASGLENYDLIQRGMVQPSRVKLHYSFIKLGKKFKVSAIKDKVTIKTECTKH